MREVNSATRPGNKAAHTATHRQEQWANPYAHAHTSTRRHNQGHETQVRRPICQVIAPDRHSDMDRLGGRTANNLATRLRQTRGFTQYYTSNSVLGGGRPGKPERSRENAKKESNIQRALEHEQHPPPQLLPRWSLPDGGEGNSWRTRRTDIAERYWGPGPTRAEPNDLMPPKAHCTHALQRHPPSHQSATECTMITETTPGVTQNTKYAKLAHLATAAEGAAITHRSPTRPRTMPTRKPLEYKRRLLADQRNHIARRHEPN